MGIKKIDIPQSTAIDASVLWGGINDNVLAAKINEVIDVVNEQQQQLNNHMCRLLALENHEEEAEEKPPKETFVSIDEALKMGKKVDPYAEQRKWIGKLCRFWDDEYDSNYIYLLKQIDDDDTPFVDDKGVCWNHCEPVKPDDDIIYKGV